MDDYERQLRAQLRPTHTKDLLSIAGLYSLAYELLKQAIVEGVRSFYLNGFDEDGSTHSDEYDQKVAKPKEAKFGPSVAWLQRAGVLTKDDVITLGIIREERHRAVHEVLALIVDPQFGLNLAVLHDAADILVRVGQYFGAIEAEFDPSLDGVDVDHSQIRSGLSLAYDYVLSAMAALLYELDTSASE